MDLLKKMKYGGICLSVALFAFGTTNAMAAGPYDADGTADIDITEPTAVPLVTQNAGFGDWAVIQSLGTTDNLVMDEEGVITPAGGAFPNTRFILIGGAPTALNFEITGAAAGEQMSLLMGEPVSAVPGSGLTGPTVTLSHAVTPGGNGTFTVSDWTCVVDDTPLGTTTPETLDAFNGALGTGSLTLGDAGTGGITEGEAAFECGMTITTVDDGTAYGSGNYVGDVRVIVDYL